MKKILITFTFLGLLWPNQSIGQSGDEVADLFKVKCGICHTIGGGKLIGPDLANVHQRHTEDWLLAFVRSSQTMIASGDSAAIAIFEENNKIPMPDPMISDTEIKSLLNYITENTPGGGTGTTEESVALSEPVSIIADATEEDLLNGKHLFEGRVRFANGGPSCISCHNQLSDVFFSENSYSTKDIAASFANLGEVGVKSILNSPPFPVMAKAFEGRKLTEAEVHDLLFFLKNAHKTPSTVPSGYLLYGILGAFGLLLLYAMFWYERKSKTVNHNIYKRQIKSTN